MTTTTTNFSGTSRGSNFGIIATIRNVFAAFGDAVACRNLIESLQRKPDSELAKLGLERSDITAYAFRQTFAA